MRHGQFWGTTLVVLLSTIPAAQAADPVPRARIALAPAEPRDAAATDAARERGTRAIPASTTWETPGEGLEWVEPGHDGLDCDPSAAETCVECCDEPAHRCRLVEWWRGLWNRDDCPADCDPCGEICCEEDDCREGCKLFTGYYLRKFTNCLRETLGRDDDCEEVECLPVCSAEGLDAGWSAEDASGWEAAPSTTIPGDRLPPGTIVIPRQEERAPPAAAPEAVPPQDWRSRRPARGASRRTEEVPPPTPSDEPAPETGADGPTLGPFVPSAQGPTETGPEDATDQDRLARRFLSEAGRLF